MNEFEKKEKEVIDILVAKSGDLTNSLSVLEKTGENHLKSQTVLLMVMIDIFSRFELIFEGKNEKQVKNSARFIGWLNKYAFTDQNEDYKNYKQFINCSAEQTYQIRNALLHFYGLPPRTKDEAICYINGQMTKEKREEFLKKNMRVVDVRSLENVIRQGVLLQFEYLKRIQKEDSKKYISGILGMYEITKWEGTKTINI